MSEKMKSKRFKLILTAITLLALAGITYGAREQVGETLQTLPSANLWMVAFIIPLIISNHWFQGKLFQGLFRILGNKFSARTMMRMSLELNFVNLVFPSAGVSGFSYMGAKMQGNDVRAGRSTLVYMARYILLFVTFQILLGVGLLLLAVVGQVNNLVILVSGSLFTLLLVGSALALWIMSDRDRIANFFAGLTRYLNKLLEKIRPSSNPETITVVRVEKLFGDLHDNYSILRKDLRRLRMPLLWALLANFVEVAVVYSVFLAFGHVVNPGAVILAYAFANFAGVISILPGGIGVYEGLMAALMTASGIPIGISLPVIVTFRMLSMSTHLPLGYYFYNKTLHSKEPPKQ